MIGLIRSGFPGGPSLECGGPSGSMVRFLSRALFLLSLLAIMTCSSSEDTRDTTGRPSGGTSVGHTRGGAVVLSRDERIAVACNRSASVVTVFLLDPTAPPDKV